MYNDKPLFNEDLNLIGLNQPGFMYTNIVNLGVFFDEKKYNIGAK